MLKYRLYTRSGIILAAGAISFEKLLGVSVSLFVSLYKEEGKVQFRLTGRACGRTYRRGPSGEGEGWTHVLL